MEWEVRQISGLEWRGTKGYHELIDVSKMTMLN